MFKILIVEDDRGIAEGIQSLLEQWGMEARQVQDFRNITGEFETYQPHLILLDIKLPSYDGYYWCGQLRQRTAAPIIFISSAADNMNIVMAMNMGGDDFIAKPFDGSVLVAKVQAMLRRSYRLETALPAPECRGAVLNTADQTLQYEGKAIDLTKVEPLWKISDQFCDKQNDLVRERLHGIRVIRAFNREEQEQGRIAEATRVMAEHIIEANTKMGLVAPIAIALMNLVAVAILYFGGSRMQSGISAASGGDIFAMVQYVALVMNGIVMAAFALVMYPHAKVAAGRIGEVMDANMMTETAEEDDNITFAGDIRMENVTFRYEGADAAAVSDVSLHIAAGQKVAIIGGTGSGKSTLVQLLMAFRLPTEGKIYFDGRDAATLSRRTIRHNISCVLQRAGIYSGTIRENIAMGRPSASEEELMEAAAVAQMADYIKAQPEGLDHRLEQAGKNLSGGQKQRVSIARAVLKNAPIYLFDDSFSALDFMTEANLRRALAEKAAGRTQIVVTQRVTSAMSSDQIFVMDGGRLVDSGTHRELLERCKVYREIYLSQTGGERR